MKIVGIAACPAGLAHTPMASKGLENSGKKLGVDVKIEQQGIMGQVNKITDNEAKEADLVLVVSTMKLKDMDRFDGKTKVRVDIGEAVKNPDLIIEKCIKKINKLRGE